MTTLQEALPCPFCGKQRTLQVISGQELMDENQEFWQHSDSFGVVCDASTPDGKGGCGAMGGFKPTEEEAITAWNIRSALAQQGEQQPVAWYEYNQDLDAWFLAYGHNPKAKTRPLVFGDTAAPAPQAQPDWLLKTTQDLANSIRRRCFPEVPQFQVLDDLAGVISQIDNMTCGMERKSAPQAQPVAQPLTLEQILDIVKKLDETPDMSHVDVLKTFARAIEKAHGINYEK